MRKGVLALLAAGLFFVACRQLVGIEDDPPRTDALDSGTDAPPACGLSVAGDACRACAEQSCCSALARCAGDPACSAFEPCAIGCAGDAACVAKCAEEHPPGLSAAAPTLDVCLATSCEAECGLSCGGPQTFAPSTNAAACTSCVDRNDCTDARACAKNLDCVTYGYCIASCGSAPDCQEACALALGDGGIAALSAVGPAKAKCATDCALAHDWRCVGHVPVPVAKAARTLITEAITIYGTPTPAANVHVKLCDVITIACDDAAATASTYTDAQGIAALALPLPFSLAFLDLSSPDIYPELVYFGFVFTEARWDNRGLGVLTPAQLNTLAAQSGVASLDPSRGSLAMYADDCSGRRAPGVKFVVSGPAAPDSASSPLVYLASGIPSPAATETDSEGEAGYFNLPPGDVQVTAYPSDLGGKASSAVTVTVRAGTLTIMEARPQ